MTNQHVTQDRPGVEALSIQEGNAVDDNCAQHAFSRNAQKYAVLLGGSATLFVGIGYTNTFGVFQEYYEETILKDERRDKIIVIGSVAASLYFILGAFTGRFADLVGYRISMLIGSGLMIGAMFAASVSKTYTHLFLSQGVMFGLGVAFTYLPAVAITRQYWSRQHGVANAVVISGGALGGCILPYLVRYMITNLGLTQAFRILGYLATGILVPSTFALKPSTRQIPIWRSRNASTPRPPLMNFELLHDARFLCLVLSCTIAMVGFLPRYFLVTPSAVAQGIDTTYASWLLGLMNGLSIVGRIGIGLVADRSDKVTALTSSFILCGVGHFVFWIPAVTVRSETTSTALFTLFVIYVGVFGSGFISLFPVVIAHLFGSEDLASKNGLLNTIIGLGTLTGPSAAYAIVGNGQMGRWWQGVLAAGLFMVVGGAVMGITLVRSGKYSSTRR